MGELNVQVKDDELQNMASKVPQTPVQQVNLIGWHFGVTKSLVNGTSQRKSDATFEYKFAENQWVIARAQFTGEAGQLKATDFNLDFYNQSFAQRHALSFANKGVVQYAAFSLAILPFIYGIFALIKCIRAPKFKRKWLWALLCIVGVVRIAVGWDNRALTISPLHVRFFSAGFVDYGDGWLVLIAFPLGAILTLRHLKQLSFIDNVSTQNTKQQSGFSYSELKKVERDTFTDVWLKFLLYITNCDSIL